MKILVVEDNPIDALVVEHALQVIGHEVTVADTAEKAMEHLRHCNYPVVISDWELPGQNGDALCQTIRERSANCYTYIIMLTSRTDKRFVINGLAAGADDYITKPFEPEELFFRIRAAERLLSLQGRDVLIFSLAKLAESRDRDTGVHLERMREYCRLLTMLLGKNPRYNEVIDADFVESIYLTSPLHDIGKVGVPDSILLKRGPLTPEQFEIMKRHTTIGGETLNTASNNYPGHHYLKMATEIAMTHHEKYNGTGYPNGLAGTEIPLCGRIVALADFYDAVTSERVYKKAYSHARACRMIRAETGSHFDPDIARVFIQHADEFNRIRTSFQKVANRTAGISKPAAKIVSPVVLGYTARAIEKKQTL
ncbi:MAG: response regulator [Planctomycetaceae bacterium]|nr:response regulator [Planctomycetaceae bacterium]